MLVQPFTDAGNRTFVCIRRRMRAMENAHFAEQKHADARSFPLADLRPKSHKQRFNVSPADCTVDWAGKNEFKRGLVAPLHDANSIIFQY